jgi:hypothetical protein
MATKDQQIYNVKVSATGRKLNTDCNPVDQPEGTHRFALNAVSETRDGEHGHISNERANFLATVISSGFYPIGEKYIQDDMNFIITVNPTTGVEELGTLYKNDVYTVLVNTKVIGLSIKHQCEVEYRLRRGNERVVYWVDGGGNAKTFNLDRVYNFYNVNYQAYLKSGGNPNLFLSEKWDGSSFDLFKSYNSIPFFSNVQVVETGAILPGSYNFAIQYVDEDLNPTGWITTSNTVNIYNDTTTNPYYRVRGSRNIDTPAQSFPRASKSIKLTITNLDNSFPYYRVAII